jgi:hypothetical protein
LNGFVHAGTAARLIYHIRRGIAACQENLSNGVFGPRRRFGSGRRPAGNHCTSHIPNCQLSGMTIAIALNRNNCGASFFFADYERYATICGK